MIKIPTSRINFSEIEDIHLKYFENNYLNGLEHNVATTSGDEQELWKYLKEKYPTILIGKKEELDELILDFESKPYSYLISTYDLRTKVKKAKNFRETIPTKGRLTDQVDALAKMVQCQQELAMGTKTLTINDLVEFRKEITVAKKYFSKLIPAYTQEIKNLQNGVREIFNYGKFIEVKGKWNAYELTESINLKTCPYCNRAYIHTYKSKEGKTRPELDHFYPKSLYPYLGLSLYNLIPSCHVCNSNLKGDKDFFLYPHTYPYRDSFEGKAKFKTEFKEDEDGKYSLDFLFGFNEESFELKILNESEDEAIKNSIQTFKIEELYKNHKDTVLHVIWKAIAYQEEYIEVLKDLFDETNEDSNIESFVSMIMGVNVNPENLGQNVLGKLTNDICKEYGII